MTPTQSENREERIAIMTADGIPEQKAQEHCNSRPEMYGIVAAETKQQSLY